MDVDFFPEQLVYCLRQMLSFDFVYYSCLPAFPVDFLDYFDLASLERYDLDSRAGRILLRLVYSALGFLLRKPEPTIWPEFRIVPVPV